MNPYGPPPTLGPGFYPPIPPRVGFPPNAVPPNFNPNFASGVAPPFPNSPSPFFRPPPFPNASLPSNPPSSLPPTLLPNPGLLPVQNPNGVLVQSRPLLRPLPPQINQITTAYVGKIAPGVEDDFIKKILDQCGKVTAWKRLADPKTGKMKGFGYCDFATAEGAMRAIRILNNLNLGGPEKLIVKVDEKTQKYLDDLLLQKKAILAAEGGNVNADERKDFHVLNFIHTLMERRENGLEYKNVEMPNNIDELIENEDPTVVDQEMRQLREREASREAERDNLKRMEEREEEERERRIRMEREREISRKREREEREFLHAEREWETRERDKAFDREREYEREMERNRRGREREARDMNYDDSERRKRTREYLRKARERKHEFDEDEVERMRELEEEEYRRRREEERERLQREAAMRMNEEHYHQRNSPIYEEPLSSSPQINTDGFLDRTKMTSGVAVQLGANNNVIEKKKIAFIDDEPEAEDMYSKKKLKLTTLDTNLHHENDRKVKLDKAKSVIEQIPTGKDELFAYPLNWELIEKHNIVEEKMKNWVTKKIVEYLGEEENVLIDFILKGIKSRTNPTDILKQIAIVLDEEGEVFVTKMWQMLIYEMLSATK